MTYSAHILAVTSLLLTRTRNRNRIAEILNNSIPAISSDQTRFTAHDVEGIELQMQQDEPAWFRYVTTDLVNSLTEGPDLNKSLWYLECGGLNIERVYLPNEASTFHGLESLVAVIKRLAANDWQLGVVCPGGITIQREGEILRIETPTAEGDDRGFINRPRAVEPPRAFDKAARGVVSIGGRGANRNEIQGGVWVWRALSWIDQRRVSWKTGSLVISVSSCPSTGREMVVDHAAMIIGTP